jgi:hypothetical protein
LRGPFHRIFALPVITDLHRFATVGVLIAPALLVAGSWGFQHHRTWGRPLMLTYAWLFGLSLFVARSIQLADELFDSPDVHTRAQAVAFGFGTLDLPVYASVYAVVLILVLNRPELRDTFTEPGGGFSPIFREKSADGQ